MRALPVLDELSRATRNEVRLGVLRGSDVLTLQPPPNRSPSACTPKRCCTVLPAHAAASGKACSPSPRQGWSTMSSRPGCPRSHDTPSPRPTCCAKDFGHPVDADRDITQRIRMRQSGDRDADLLRRGPVAAAIELTVRDLGSESSRPSAPCRSRAQPVPRLATEFHVRANRNGKPGNDGGRGVLTWP